jgi:hypothetical protein
LSNRKSAAFARDLMHEQLRQLVLLHLSEVNNTPKHAVGTMEATLRGAKVRRPVTAAPQDRAAGPFGDSTGGVRQLALAL